MSPTKKAKTAAKAERKNILALFDVGKSFIEKTHTQQTKMSRKKQTNNN